MRDKLNSINSFEERLNGRIGATGGLHAIGLRTLQVNIGLSCNLECSHCHVASSPRRKEQMDRETMEHILRAARSSSVETVDITGGAPEMNPHFREFVEDLRKLDLEVMVRTNLTILLEPGYEDLPEFFKNEEVHLIASLPCYLEENVDAQRGSGVYRGSIEAMRKLNAIGYGTEPASILDLVYNPVGPHLPPSQESLDEDYRRELKSRFGISFNRLIAIANMPIGQYLGALKRQGKAEEYACLLKNSFNPETVEGLMCRDQIGVGWDGRLYDCDFNLALRLPLVGDAPRHISEFDAETLKGRRIATGSHCFGCTAGAGSSCGGALVK
jgi:radical SAM/Cys-rich protein